MDQENQIQKQDNKGLVSLKTSPKQYWISIQPTTALAAFSSPTQSIAKIKKEMGDTMANAFLTLIVTDLVQSFNVGKTMDQNQIVFAVQTLKSDYYFLKPEELKYCFDKAKKGRYGVVYDRIDSSIIFDWIEKYLEERMELAYQQNIESQKQAAANGEEILGAMLDNGTLKASDLLKISIEQKPKPKEKRELTESEKVVQEIFREFDAEWIKKPMDPKERMRTIEYNGKFLAQEEYLKARLEEMNLL